MIPDLFDPQTCPGMPQTRLLTRQEIALDILGRMRSRCVGEKFGDSKKLPNYQISQFPNCLLVKNCVDDNENKILVSVPHDGLTR
jgi:hypothetical protein